LTLLLSGILLIPILRIELSKSLIAQKKNCRKKDAKLKAMKFLDPALIAI
jgi:hypothetical protein